MTETTVAVSRRRLTLATGVQVGGRILGAMLGVLVAAALARSLSRPEFGELALALTVLGLAGSLGDFGISQIAIREMARRPEDRARIAGALCVAQLVMGVVLGVLGAGVALLLMKGAQPRLMAALVMATMPLGAVGAFNIAAQARLRPELVITPVLVQSVIWLGAVLLLDAVHAGLALYGAGYAVSALAQAAVTLALGARITALTFTGTRRTIISLLASSWPIGLAGVSVTAYYKIDGVILFHYRGATASAYYSAAYRVIDVLQILPATISGVLFPLLAGAQREGAAHGRVEQLFEFSIALLLAAALPVAACGAIIAPSMIDLIYGPHFHYSSHLLQILLPAFIPICMGWILTGQLILHGMMRPYIVITAVGAVLNVLANAIAIPKYGAAAAAWATTATELIVMTAVGSVVVRRIGLWPPVQRILRCCGAVAVTSVVVWLIRSQPLPVSLAVAIAVYLPCLFMSRALTVDELRALFTREAAADA